ncbi:MAG TPA: metalloregulator ArsR/SmtB family transcription factor [Rhodoferax sp.]|nr:metalloregulator ArsR/SmtB family transcription factor [Rhodoferax sp.]
MPPDHRQYDAPDEVFERAAGIFRILAAPNRLKIISYLCHGEQNVSYLLDRIDTSQANMSQHLNAMYLARVLKRRRDGVRTYYCMADDRIAHVCKAVCAEVENRPGFQRLTTAA